MKAEAVVSYGRKGVEDVNLRGNYGERLSEEGRTLVNEG